MENITNFDFNELAKFDKIWCLVSGGLDSTYLYEMIYTRYPTKTYAVNCWNPYEQSKTLDIFRKLPNYIEVVPDKRIDYKKILVDSFKLIPKAIEFRKAKKYEKKIFHCCKYIKHKAFKKDPMFKEENTVVISGIKAADGKFRAFFLKDLRKGSPKRNYSRPIKPGFFHQHKGGQMYCYPFRDYYKRELPLDIITEMREKYALLSHSGCKICPVLVVFQDRIKHKRVKPSVDFYNRLMEMTA